MSEPTVVRHQEGGVLTIRLNRPDKLNAFDLELVDGLLDGLEHADRDASVRCVVLSAAGRGFSAGQDLDLFAEHYRSGERIDVARHLRRTYNAVALRLRALPKPVIAAVHGFSSGWFAGLPARARLRERYPQRQRDGDPLLWPPPRPGASAYVWSEAHRPGRGASRW